MAPENRPSKKEIRIPTIHFQVSFREDNYFLKESPKDSRCARYILNGDIADRGATAAVNVMADYGPSLKRNAMLIHAFGRLYFLHAHELNIAG